MKRLFLTGQYSGKPLQITQDMNEALGNRGESISVWGSES